MKHLMTLEKFFQKKKESVIEYKEEKGKYYKRNPKGGKWVEIPKSEYKKS